MLLRCTDTIVFETHNNTKFYQIIITSRKKNQKKIKKGEKKVYDTNLIKKSNVYIE